MTDPKRREQRRTHLDASVVPVERALLARAGDISASANEVLKAVGDTATAETLAAHIRLDVAQEFRALGAAFLVTREQLDQRYAAAIRKWARTIADMTGTVPRSLLADLAGIAEEHAAQVSTPKGADTAPPQNLHPAESAPPQNVRGPARTRRTTDRSTDR